LGRRLVFCLVQAPLAILVTLACASAATLGGLVRPGFAVWLSREWSSWLLRLFRVEVVTRGVEHLPEGAAVYAANHSSTLDILVVLAHLPRAVRIIFKRSLGYIPLLGWSMALAGHIPIDRSNPFRARRSLDLARERIRGGTSVLVFPEGTRSRDGRVHHFKRGSFSLAIEAGAPVVPLSLAGVKALVPAGMFSLRPGRVTLRVHPAISVTGRAPGDAHVLAEEARAIVARGCETEASA
jgi:1-acyl-sn-glycerol-3-phosphate acyltransferase